MRPLPFEPIIAEAFRRAALTGRDMYAFAGGMEQAKAAVPTQPDLYKQWEKLDDLIGGALWMAADTKPFHLLRTVFQETLGDHFSTCILQPGAPVGEAWPLWRQAFSEAGMHWRIEAMECLCTAPAFTAMFGDRIKPFADFIPLFRDRRWVDIRPVFYDLATDTSFDDEHRGSHLYVCGQIDLYFHYQYEQAKRIFEQAGQLLKGKPVSKHGLIEYYLKGPAKDRDPDRAMALAEEALRLDPTDVPSILQKAYVLAQKNLNAEAENLYLEAARMRPGYTRCLTGLIDLYGKPEMFPSRESEIEKLLLFAIELEPDGRFQTRSDVAVIFQSQGESYLPKAEALHLTSIEQYPEGIMARLNLGYMYLNTTGELDKAEACFQQVADMAPTAYEGHYALAILRETQEQWETAATLFDRVRQIIPSWDRFMLVGIGRCLLRLQRHDEAKAYLLDACALDEYDDSGALGELYSLAEALYQTTENSRPDDAVALLEAALERRDHAPENAAGIVNRQGHALFYVERYDEALPYYRKAASIMPLEPVYYTNQFDCLEKLYQKTLDETLYQDALEALEHAARAAPQDTSVVGKRRRLARIRHNPRLVELPILYHIYVETGYPLIDQITEDWQTLRPEMMDATEALRKRFNDRFALQLPGLRYRDLQDQQGAFQFQLYETPVLYDSLPVSSENPPAMTTVLDRLETFLVSHALDQFINFRDVDGAVPYLPNAELVHFTRVIMALLAEQVPLAPLPDMYKLYVERDGPRIPVVEMAEKLRLSEALRPELPGTAATYRYLPLDDEVETELLGHIASNGNSRLLALTPDHAGFFLRHLQDLEENRTALVVRQEILRAFLKSLCMMSGLPGIPVLKTAELPQDAQSRFLAPLRFSS